MARGAHVLFAHDGSAVRVPAGGRHLAAIAARELPGVEGADQQLLSWNLHLAARRTIGLLPSDVVFTEPPPAR